MIATWLANKLAAPILLAATIIFGLLYGFTSYQLHGLAIIKDIPLIGQYVWQGYEPLYEAQVKADLQRKLDNAARFISETKKRDDALETANADLNARLGLLQNRLDHYTPSEVIRYVPKTVSVACVPAPLLWMLDASGTGADISTATPGPGESIDSCANMDVSGAESALMRNIAKLPAANERILNALAAWEVQRKIGQSVTVETKGQ